MQGYEGSELGTKYSKNIIQYMLIIINKEIRGCTCIYMETNESIP